MTIYKVGTKKYNQANKKYGKKKRKMNKAKILSNRLKQKKYVNPFRKYFSTEFSFYR